MTIGDGGMLPDGMKLPATVRIIREVEPGLSVVSINEGAPEFLMSSEWLKENTLDALAGLNAKLNSPVLTEAEELRQRFEALAAIWEARADHDEKFAQSVPEDVQDAMLDAVADWRQRAGNVRAVLEEVPRSGVDPDMRRVSAPDAAASGS
jgi:hypothetical protein